MRVDNSPSTDCCVLLLLLLLLSQNDVLHWTVCLPPLVDIVALHH